MQRRTSISAKISLATLFIVALLALLGPYLPIQDPAAFHPEQSLQAPAWLQQPVLGTDAYGRDLLARTIWGARVSLLVGLLGTLVALLVGVPYGAISGFLGGRTDRIMMRLADTMESVPMVAFVLFLLSILQEYRSEMAALGIGRLHLLFFAVGLLFWLPTARVARSEALRLRDTAFSQAATAVGSSPIRTLKKHILPHLAAPVIVMLGLTLPRVILMEAFLSFLGLGVEAPNVSWGSLASEGLASMNPLIAGHWLFLVPAAALATTLLALHTLGDHLRDRFEKSRRL
ncbi:MAG: ABC transporter permease [Planctomycetes bacterium]|jgi:oligopeptide transport system permease protein|nr:ABC transporter permease [Planctomycetota bacterium]MBT4028325.1 ABC transporter permease [Planctomycetota bacterium]MBT4560882.1 ABC transporter permease [Planctomycetota bacterium]MBT5100966.1 ABC transporter permease [Planctomycetota bacterium]MBT5120429.1 ABC transporter permease [Planctomycetota bacterium]